MRLSLLCLIFFLAWSGTAYGAEDEQTPSIAIGGRFEGHTSWSDQEFGAKQKGRDTLYFPDIPLSGAGRDGDQFHTRARESRLWLRALRPLGERDVEAYFEWDFNNKPDSYKIRLRHAFLNFGPVLAGRTYTTFINTAALPDIDSGDAPGEVTLKRDQLRWTGAVAEDLQLSVALEQTDTRVAMLNDGAGARFQSYDDDHIPNFVSRLTRFTEHGEYSLAGMVRSLRWQGPNGKQSVWAGGLGFSGRFNFNGRDNLRLMANYGNGLGRYLTSGSYADAYYDTASGELSRNTVASIEAAYQHFWHERWRSTLSIAHSSANLPGDAHPDLIDSSSSLQLNLLYSPVPDLSTGFEFLHAYKTLKGGDNARLNRLLFVVRYNFAL